MLPFRRISWSWVVVICLAVLALGLGLLGFRQHFAAVGVTPPPVLPRYQDFAARLGAAAGDEPMENSICVRLKRTDSLSGLEHYVLFRRGVFLGSDPSCAVLVSHACVAPRHARILHLNDCFWLEAMAPVHVGWEGTDEQIPQNRLVRLKPGITLRFGDREVQVVDDQQHFIAPNSSRVE